MLSPRNSKGLPEGGRQSLQETGSYLLGCKQPLRDFITSAQAIKHMHQHPTAGVWINGWKMLGGWQAELTITQNELSVKWSEQFEKNDSSCFNLPFTL